MNTLPDGRPCGSGAADRQLAEALAAASTDTEANAVARGAGFANARAAEAWLGDRS